jgi:hypothetical protein
VIVLLALTLPVALGALIWLIERMRLPNPAHLELVCAGYELNVQIPHNVHGKNALKRLLELARSRGGQWYERIARYDVRPDRIVDLDSVASAEWKADGSGPSRKAMRLSNLQTPTVIVIMALHGGSDESGAYLILQDTKATPDTTAKLRLTDVIDTLASLPPERNKVLVMDATRLDYHLELGMVRNSFARELQALDKKIRDVPRLVVFSASGANERSWVDRASNESVFLRALIDRMIVPRSRGGRINFGGLVDTVAQDVEEWVWAHRETLQRPVLLPLGEEGQRRAAEIELPVLLTEGGAAPPPLDAGQISADLLARWDDYQKVEGPVVPPFMPYVITPGFWRLFQANTVRFDELARAGDLTSAGELGERFQIHKTVMRGLQVRKLGSALATLSMPILTGQVDPLRATDPEVARRFDRLWSLPEAEQSKEWAIWKAEAGARKRGRKEEPASAPEPPSLDRFDEGSSRELLTAQVGGLILDRAIADPERNLQRAARLARIIDDPLEVRSQELHFLVMLDRDLPRRSSAVDYRVVARALKVRRLGERAMMGLPEEGRERPDTVAIPEVSAFVREAMFQGDEQRQRGQDLLFAGDKASWQEADSAFRQAEGLYQNAISIGSKMRRALHLRDRVFADLPEYTRWLLQLRFPRGRPQVLEVLRNHLLDLWRKAHRLNEALAHADAPDQKPAAGETSLEALSRLTAKLSQLAGELEQALSVIKTDLTAYVAAILATPGKAAMDVYANHLALSVLEPRERERLERVYWESRRLESATESNPRSSRAEISRNEQASEAAILTRNRGLIALEVLGEHELARDCGGTEPTTAMEDDGAPLEDKYYQLKEQLTSLADDPSSGPVEERDLRRLGTEIGTRLACLVERFNKQGRTLGTQAEPNQTKTTRRSTRLADDELIRRIGPVGMFNADPVLLFRDPIPVNRLAGFLRSQGRRASDDRWYDEESREGAGQTTPPYFDRVARVFLGDVKGLGALPGGEPAETWPIGDLRLISANHLVLTSEPWFEVAYRLEADADPVLERGVAVAWIDQDPDHFIDDRAAGAGVPLAIPLVGGKSRALTTRLVAPSVPEWTPTSAPVPPRETSLVAKALFRGRVLRRSTPVTIAPVPDLRFVQVPATRAGIAVTSSTDLRGNRLSPDGAVTIVLDASGSMGTAPGQPGNSKYMEAIGALERVLSHLPRQTQVSVWVFGQAMGEGRTVPAERAIRCVLPAVSWRPDLLPALVKELADIRPWNESAVVRAMFEASQDLEGSDGYRALVLLTDGMDNRWLTDVQANPQRLDVAAALRSRFDQSGIAVHVIAYRVSDAAERSQVREQFHVVTQFKTPGTFLLADEAAALVPRLEKSMPRGLNYRVLQGDNRTIAGIPAIGIPVGRPGVLDHPLALDPGGYQIWLQRDERPGREFVVDPGRWLLMKVVPRPGSPSLQVIRGLYASELFPLRPSRRDALSGWMLSAIQNRTLDAGGLETLVALEKTYDRQEAILQSIYPRDVWIDLAPESGDRSRIATRVVALPGYPASVWSVDAANWPAGAESKVPAAPVVEAWWDPDRAAPPDVSLEPGRHFGSLDELRGRTFEIADERVTIESLSIETRTVMINPQSRAERPCLVVRMAHPRDRAIRVRLDAAGIAGSEERYYMKVGKSMALFWPMTSDQALTAIRRLDLVTVHGFKREAERRGFHIRLDGLGPPASGDVRPPAAEPARAPQGSTVDLGSDLAPIPDTAEGR